LVVEPKRNLRDEARQLSRANDNQAVVRAVHRCERLAVELEHFLRFCRPQFARAGCDIQLARNQYSLLDFLQQDAHRCRIRDRL